MSAPIEPGPEIGAWVLLPDNLHAVWTMPAGDAEFPRRWRLIKTRFSHGPSAGYGSGGIGSIPRRRRLPGGCPGLLDQPGEARVRRAARGLAVFVGARRCAAMRGMCREWIWGCGAGFTRPAHEMADGAAATRGSGGVNPALPAIALRVLPFRQVWAGHSNTSEYTLDKCEPCRQPCRPQRTSATEVAL